MNWYRTAISYQDFMRFYALSSISDEVLEANPRFLYDLIDHINYIREYYLDYLLKEVGDELGHWRRRYDLEDSDGSIRVSNDERKEIYDKVQRVLDNFYGRKPSSSDFTYALHIFNDYHWDRSYGGLLWGEVTKWTQLLYNTGQVPQTTYNPGVVSKIKDIAFIIDTIHSVEHNTSFILRDLPENEKIWLPIALELAKNMPHPAYLADLSEDKALSDLYRHDVMPQGQPMDIEQKNRSYQYKQEFKDALRESQRVADILEEMKKYDSTKYTEQYILTTNEPDVIKAALEISYYMTAVYLNPNMPDIINEVIDYFMERKKHYTVILLMNKFTEYLDIDYFTQEIAKTPNPMYLQEMAMMMPDINMDIINKGVREHTPYDNIYEYWCNAYRKDPKEFEYAIKRILGEYNNEAMVRGLAEYMTSEERGKVFNWAIDNYSPDLALYVVELGMGRQLTLEEQAEYDRLVEHRNN